MLAAGSSLSYFSLCNDHQFMISATATQGTLINFRIMTDYALIEGPSMDAQQLSFAAPTTPARRSPNAQFRSTGMCIRFKARTNG